MKFKYHEFFRSVDWSALVKKQIEPPIVPNKLNNDVRGAYLKKDSESVEDLLGEMSEEEDEQEEEGFSTQPLKTSRSKTRKQRSNKGAREYRLFENFEFHRANTITSK